MKFANKFCGAMLLISILGMAFSVQAQTFQSKSFLGDGVTNVLVVNGTLPAGSAVAIATNTYAGATNAVAIQTGTNGWGVNANYMKAGGYYTNNGAFVDVPLWADRDGTPPSANISVHIKGVNAAFTNILAFQFAVIPRGNKVAATVAQNLFTFTATGNGTNDVCLATNLPTSWLQGNGAIRLLTVTPSNAGTNGALLGIGLNGYSSTQ